MTLQELNSTFDRLVSDWNGKALLVLPSTIADNTNVPENQKRGQCFDVSAKFTDMLGIPHYPGNPTPFPYQNASEIYTRPNSVSSQYFNFIPNTPEFVPQKGDICVFSGIPGHVSVATGKGDLNTFESFDQNFPTGSVCKLVTHNYNNLLGVLRLKVTQNTMDRRPYWFDLINKVVWNKPHEQIKDSEVELFTKEYPNQKTGNGKWSQLCNLVYQGNVDSNKITVEQLWSEIHKNCKNDELKKKVISFVQSL